MARLRFSLLALFSLCLTLFPSGAFSQATFTITNSCPYTVWPGLLPNSGSPGAPTTGFMLTPYSSASLSMPAAWSGNIWGRTQCSNSYGPLTCVTGNCGSGTECNGAGGSTPATLAEIQLNGYAGLDYYDVSLVNGFNVPMSVAPQGGSGTCSAITCAADINAACPAGLQDVVNGVVVGCKSGCVAYGDPQDCCTGPYMPPNCGPTGNSEFFKGECPQAITYASDGGLITCASGGYTITFCP